MRRPVKLCACVVPLAFVACGDDPASPVPGEAASLAVSADTVRLTALDAAYPLEATVSDANGIALGDVSVSWSSGDESIATVDGSGRVEAVGEGETEVTAEAGGASDAAIVIVTQNVASLSVSPTVGELSALGDSVRFTVTARDANGHAIEGAAAGWSSADTAVATVDEAGWVTARANGTATITATAGDVSAHAAAVIHQVVASIDVSPAADTLGQDATTQLDAVLHDANGAVVTGRPVTWTTADPSLATVDGAGRVTGVGWDGDVTITAAAEGVSGTAAVHVLGQFMYYAQVDAQQDVYVIDADGSNPRNISRHAADERVPAWSPDGSRIAFASDRTGALDVFVMDADGSDQTSLSLESFGPDWSSDGSQIAFRSSRDGDYEVFIMYADGSAQTQLTFNTAIEFDPTLSPDGTQIAFATNRDAGNREIYVMNADGSSQTNITNDAAWDYAPAWSPDGTKIAFISDRDPGDGTTDFEIWTMNTDGTGAIQLTDNDATEADPSWTPDGRIVFLSDRDPGDGTTDDDIYIMNADGSGQTAITATAFDEQTPSWRPRP